MRLCWSARDLPDVSSVAAARLAHRRYFAWGCFQHFCLEARMRTGERALRHAERGLMEPHPRFTSPFERGEPSLRTTDATGHHYGVDQAFFP